VIDEFEMLEEVILTPMHAFLDILDTISVEEFKCAQPLLYFSSLPHPLQIQHELATVARVQGWRLYSYRFCI